MSTLYNETGADARINAWCVAEEHYLYGDLSYTINGILMKVHREVGPGWDEWDYHQCLMEEFRLQGLPARSKLRGILHYREQEADRFELDVLINGQIIVELKHQFSGFVPANFIQIINYMTYWQMPVGILANFGQESLSLRRLQMPETLPQVVFAESDSHQNSSSEKLLAELVTPLVDAHLHTYALVTLNRLLKIEAQYRGIELRKLIVAPVYKGLHLKERDVDAWVLNEQVLVQLCANPDGPSKRNRAILRTYLNQTNLQAALLVNFTTKQITITKI